MATYIFETMSATDAANFTSSDRLTFQASVSNLLQADIDEAAGRITFGAFTGIDTGNYGDTCNYPQLEPDLLRFKMGWTPPDGIEVPRRCC